MKFSINTNQLKKHYAPARIVQECLKAGVQGIEWGLGPLDKAAAEASLAAQIETQKNPPVVAPPLPWAVP